MKSSDSPRREFESILAALTERSLTDWETDRLWELLAEREDWIPEYVDHCQMATMLEALKASDFTEAPTNIIAIESPSSDPDSTQPTNRRSPVRYAILAAAATIAVAALVFLKARPDEAAPSMAEVTPSMAPTEAAEEPKTETPIETYDRVIAMIPAMGSQTRPPTQFASLKGQPSDLPETIGFNEHVRPILSENCFHCHGPDSGSRKADLRLDTEEGISVDLGGYFAIKPGDAENSEVMARVLDTDPDSVMPPPESHKTMKPEEIAILARWIDEGATWEGHWSFTNAERPAVPEIESHWAKNEIDAFVLQKLDEKGLVANPEADRYTLARRVSLDLTGLPPTPEQIDEFVSDSSVNAYERYVDRLLASPHYGEHRARFWLDAARYGDTHGLHLDNHREMWPWRDWVINAFNENKPFDEFTIEQLAGDLLANPTTEQLIATGFNRCNVSSSEGGSIPEELQVRNVIDRVETTSTVFMGLTTGCAVCHDHKFDPISQKDFYELAAFFNNQTDPAMDGNQKDTPPVIVLPEGELATEWDQLMTMRADLRRQMEQRAKELKAAEPSPATFDQPVPAESLRVALPLSGANGTIDGWVHGERRVIEEADSVGPSDRGISFVKKGGLKIPDAGTFDPDAAFTISLWIKPSSEVGTGVIFQQLETIKKEGKKDDYRGFKLYHGTNNNLGAEWRDGAGKVLRVGLPGETPLKPNEWQHLLIRYSGSRAESALQYHLDGQRHEIRPGTEDLIEFETSSDLPLELGNSFEGGQLDNFRLYDRWLTDIEVTLLANEGQLDQPEFRDLQALVFDEAYRTLNQKFAMTQTRRDFIAYRSTTSMIMAEQSGSQPMAHILDRGEYDQKKESVTPAVLDVLPPLPEGTPENRLGLAKWLVSGDHPLTARVIVNRLWLQTFGVGLVKSAEDFGVMGEAPSHPELLDWLAVEFVESGWDVKHLVRLMVTSSAYRQDAKMTPEEVEADADNRYLARGPRRRLDAEVLRDQALQVSGLLNSAMGGPSVKPPQPAGLWEVVAQGGSNTKKFAQDTGEDVYRRSVYTYWKRTSPPPPMAIFNAPSRESCTVRRERTNTPLQALVLLNEVQFVESARALAERMIEAHDDPKRRLEVMTQQVTGRPIEETDRAVLEYAATDFTEYFEADPAAAKELIQTGDTPPAESHDPVELAAWTMLANTLLNRDDVINSN